LTVTAYDNYDIPITGVYAEPITLTLQDSTPGNRTVLACAKVYSSQQVVSLIYSGRGDHFTITATAKGVQTSTVAIATVLPKEMHFGLPPNGMAAIGSDGNIWTALRYSNIVPVIGKITPGGALTKYVIRNKNLWPNYTSLIRGNDGNIWFTLQNNGSVDAVIARITPQGSVSLSANPPHIQSFSASSMATDKEKTTWVAAASYGTAGAAVYRSDRAGNLRVVATLPSAPFSLVADPRGRGMWFGTTTQIGLVTTSGKVTLHKVPGANGQAPLEFFLGPDGKFWAPWTFGNSIMTKFDLSGRVVSLKPLATTAGIARNPSLMTRDRFGNTYMIDWSGNSLIRLSPDGTPSSFTEYAPDGWPISGVVTGGDGNIYFTDETTDGVAGGLAKFDPKFW
jgi:hypothetical protein